VIWPQEEEKVESSLELGRLVVHDTAPYACAGKEEEMIIMAP